MKVEVAVRGSASLKSLIVTNSAVYVDVKQDSSGAV